MKTNQKGFSVVEMLIVVVVIGLLGAVGWLVYDRQNSKNREKPATQISEQQKDTTKDEAKVETLPEGFVSYENKELGFSFYYPQDWGTVTKAAPTNNDKLLFAGTFDKQSDISFAVAPKDYTPPEYMGDTPCFENGFGAFAYAEITNLQYLYSKELVKTENKQVVESYKSGYCTGAKLQGRVKLSLDKSNGISITYFKQTDPQYSGSEVVSAQEYMKNNSIADKLKADFLKAVDSFKSIN